MNPTVTVEQLKDLWNGEIPGGLIERGDDYAPLAREDILALINGGCIDCDDDGNPLENDWAVIADQFASERPGEPTGGPQRDALQAITDIVHEIALGAIRSASDGSGSEGQRLQDSAKRAINDGIRHAVLDAISRRTPVAAIANGLQVTPGRVYQIRDGR